MKDYERRSDKEATRGIIRSFGSLVVFFGVGALFCYGIGWHELFFMLALADAGFATILLLASIYALANDY